MWNIEEETGYHPITTFWDDFSIADRFGAGAVIDTYNRAMNSWKKDYKYLTELVMVLNHKIWQWYKKNEVLATTYNSLWMKADEYACSHLTGTELSYFYDITD